MSVRVCVARTLYGLSFPGYNYTIIYVKSRLYR